MRSQHLYSGRNTGIKQREDDDTNDNKPPCDPSASTLMQPTSMYIHRQHQNPYIYKSGGDFWKTTDRSEKNRTNATSPPTTVDRTNKQPIRLRTMQHRTTVPPGNSSYPGKQV
jgi:hypothetical protein